MVVLLATGRDEAFLFIFRPIHGHWRLSYSKTSSLPYIWQLSVRGRALIEKRPFFDSALCCPSGYSYWAVSWNGHGWTVRPTQK
jgi:hypothetical protein